MYPELVPPKPQLVYVPRIYGFKIHKSAKSRSGGKDPSAASSTNAVADRDGGAGVKEKGSAAAGTGGGGGSKK